MKAMYLISLLILSEVYDIINLYLVVLISEFQIVQIVIWNCGYLKSYLSKNLWVLNWWNLI